MNKKKTNIYLQRLNSFSKEVDYKYNCISLFSGGGGLDLGAHFAGFKTLLVSDIIPAYTETIKANLPHVSVYNDDAMDLTAEKIRGLANVEGDVDLIIAGPPCQAFSIMGKRQSLDDPRGKLTIKYFELVSGLRPKVFMFENVPGLMTVNHGEDFNNLLEFIENETGYQLYRTKLNASDFGIPQERERIFIVGFRPDISCESFSFPSSATGPLHDQLPDKMPSKYALESVDKSQLSPSLMQSYGENFNYESFTELQAHYNIQIRPAVLIWKILYKLWESGEQPILSLDEMQGYAVRCTDMTDYLPCTESIIESRHDGPQLQPLTRARRNMADWMKLLSQTLLFNVSGDGNTIALSTYSIKERKSVDYVCSSLSNPSSFWEYKEDNFKQDWFDFYGDYDNSIEYVLKESK